MSARQAPGVCLRVSILVAGLLLAGPAPLGSAQVMQGPAPSADVTARLAAMGPAASDLFVDVSVANGPLRAMRGPLDLAGADIMQRTRDFVVRYGPMFGITPDILVEARDPVVQLPVPRGGKPASARQVVRLVEVVQGAKLEDYGFVVSFDGDGHFVSAHGAVSHAAAYLPAPTVDGATATTTALAALAAAGHDTADLRAGPSAALVARVLADGPHLIRAVSVVLRKGAQPLTVEVDAHTGAVLALRDTSLHAQGSGNFHYQGQSVPFATGSGKGTVYRNLANAAAGKATGAKLPDVALQGVVQGLAENGFLFGRFAQMIDDSGAVAFSASHDWSTGTDDAQSAADLSDPLAPGQTFDHTDTYFWLTRAAHSLEKAFGPLGTDYAMPVIVNVQGLLNAFYSPADLALGHGPGFFAFGDASGQTGDFMDDFSRDPTVSCHEYTHGVFDKFGLSFGDAATDTPSRALNEAMADTFASGILKTPCMGGAFMQHLGPKLDLEGTCLRDLSADRVMPGNLFDSLGETGLPEEHEAGVIFGGTLYRVRGALRNRADAAFAASSFDFPLSAAEVGFPVVDTNNALDAYTAYYAVSLWELLDRVQGTLPPALRGKALGAALQLGAIGDLEAGTWWLADLSGGGRLAWKSVFVPGVDDHAVGFFAPAGSTVSIKVAGSQGAAMDFTLLVEEGAATLTQAKQSNAAGTSLTLKGVAVQQDSILVLDVVPGTAFGGAYKATIAVKP